MPIKLLENISNNIIIFNNFNNNKLSLFVSELPEKDISNSVVY